jgi:hypothetical protein
MNSEAKMVLKASAGGSPMPVSLADGLRATALAEAILGVLRNGGD